MSASGKNGDFTIERTYRASVDDVWALWTTKEGFESWWGPVGFRADVHELEARVGGPLVYDMVADSPAMIAEMERMGQPASHATRSRFVELVPRSRLVIRNVIDFVPGVPTFENDITVELHVVGDRVRMVVTLQRMASGKLGEMQAEGFGSQLTKLDARFG